MTSRRKFLIVSSTFPNARAGGVPTYVHGRATYLCRKHDVTVTALGNPEGAQLSGNDYNRISLGDHCSFSKIFPLVWLKLITTLIRLRPDFIECHNIPVAIPIFWLFRVRYFFHGPAGMEAKIEGKGRMRVTFSEWLERKVFSHSIRVMAVSLAFKNLAISIHGDVAAKRLQIRRPRLVKPVNLPSLRAMSEHPDPSLNLVCVRRLVKRTGVSVLVSAFAKALIGGHIPSHAKLHIIGVGPEEELVRQMISDFGVSAQVIMYGSVTDDFRDRMFRESAWNIVPTQDLEGFGLVVVEAAQEGCPSLCTSVGALPEVMNLLGGMGHLCEPSENGLITGLIEIATNSQIDRIELARRASIKFSSNPTG